MVAFVSCALGSRRAAARGLRLGRVLFLLAMTTVRPVAWGQIELPRPQLDDPITIFADAAHHWRQGVYDVWLLQDNCCLRQGPTSARSSQAVLWIRPSEPGAGLPSTVVAYLEGDVTIDQHRSIGERPTSDAPVARVVESHWFGRFDTCVPLQMELPPPGPEPDVKPAIFERGMVRFKPDRDHAVRPAQHAEAVPRPAPGEPVPPGTRRIRFAPRSEVPVQARWFPTNQAGDEFVAIVGPGVNLIIDGLNGAAPDALVDVIGTVDMIDVEADWLVIWTAGIQPDLSGQTLQSPEAPLEVYMEGNIVFRQGDRTIYAGQMYYDVRKTKGVVLDAEILTPVPDYEGLLRLKSQVLRQLDQSRFVAQEARLTSSRLGEPSYFLQAGTIAFEDVQVPAIDPFTGVPQIDPETGLAGVDHQRLATSQNNFLYVGGLPVFYWPTLSTDLEKPQYYVDGFSLKSDGVFGTQALLDLDAYQLLGVRSAPKGTDWSFSLDYLSDRGLGYGTSFDYDRPGLLSIPGLTQGDFDAWFIQDHGLDNLGRDRRAVAPEKDFRGRTFWNHRQQLYNNFTLSAELGWISDRNFLEQYYEREWDEWKDETTDVELKQVFDNQSWAVLASGRLNEFFTQTEWLPRLDHFWLGQPLLGNRLTWFEHSQAGYARLRPATAPIDPEQAARWAPLPWEPTVQGERLVTRQELDLPFELGPVKVIPYALGELGHWGEDINGDPIDRAYFQAGLRASLPFWAIHPEIESQLLNLHGLAHKVVLDAELSYADCTRNLEELPLYDPIDDNSIQAFERVYPFTTFNATVPGQFDPRFYALRTGLQGWVTAPATEIADDLSAVRMGMRHRWQTKRGGSRRIIDWVTLDTNAVWFPDADRDNFGEDIGLVDYDFRWHVGDRLTLVSDGGFDFFSDGLRTVSFGGFLTRPPRGSAYLGYRTFSGPFNSNVLNASYGYWMSPKWVSTLGTSIDFGNTGNIGQRFSVTRIGESLLVTLGFNYDASKGSAGVHFMVEPRFLPRTQFAGTPGLQIPVAGAFGLE